MAVVTTLAKGYDHAYPFKQMRQQEAERAADYYLVPGEPQGRWYGRAAAALGLAPGSVVDRRDYDLLVGERVDPRDGTRLGRSPARAIARTEAIYQGLLTAEPHATAARKHQLHDEALRQSRQGPLYFDLTVSLSKSISVFYASIGENARLARIAGNQDGAAYWAGLLAEIDEMIYQANQAGLEFFEAEAGYTRSGYHGARVEGRESGRWHEAGLAVATFLQHTSREDDIQLHLHNVIAHVARTDADGKWRAPDSYGYNRVFGAVSAFVSLHLEAALSRRFGLAWKPRSDFGHEIDGIGKDVLDCFSSRRESISADVRERAAEFERAYGRAPSQRELAELAQQAVFATREGKEGGGLDFEALHASLSAKLRRETGAELASIAPSVWGGGPGTGSPAATPGGGPGPTRDELDRAAAKALAACQAQSPAWTRYDLIKHLGRVLPASCRQLDPAATGALVTELAGETIASRHGEVVCLEAPEFPRVPDALRRADGRSIYHRHGDTRYATRAQLSLEEQMLADASRRGAPAIERERAAQLLGSDSATLDAQLRTRAAAGAGVKTRTGLRLDQAAAVYAGLTDDRVGAVLTGPAGSGKTYTLVAVGHAAKNTGVPEVWGVTCSQAARNVLAEAAGRAGLAIRAYNSENLLRGLGSGRLQIAPGSVILIDEANMVPAGHLARLLRLAGELRCKVIAAGDQEQLAAVEGGGGMRLLSRQLGYLQLAEPVRFDHDWERSASLRLRAGDASVLAEYDQHGRIRGGDPETAMDEAARITVAQLLAGQDVLLIAREKVRCRELSRRVRDDLIHLGLVGDGPAVPLVGGVQAGVQDLVILRKNDHGAGLANGDVLRIEAISDEQVIIRRATGRDPQTGAPVFADRSITYGSLREFDHAYATSAHSAEGRTVTVGIALVTGAEDRQWLYVAMTRGTASNHAIVMTGSPRTADILPGPAPAPELARYDRTHRPATGGPSLPGEKSGDQRAWLDVPYGDCGDALAAGARWDPVARRWYAPEPGNPALARWEPADDHREPAAVLADVLARDGAQKSATEMRRQALADADHLAVLNAMWQEETALPRTECYQTILRDSLPPGLGGGAAEAGQATWLWRTLRAAEAAGLDARPAVTDAIASGPLDDARDVASVLDYRIRQRIATTTPLPPGPWSDQVPDLADPARQQFARELAAAMDERKQRLGRHAAELQPPWATAVLGVVPADPAERQRWEQRAANIAAYRELYGWTHPDEPIGPEPASTSPEQRAAWHAGHQALGPVDGPDVRGMSDGALWRARDAYAAETGWAPRYVTPELRQARLGADDAQLAAVLAAAEARAAEAKGDQDTAALHHVHARSASALHAFYQGHTAHLEQADQDYRDWEHVTEHSRLIGVAADAELRRRHPERKIEPLTSAEPARVTDTEREQLSQAPGDPEVPYQPPAWIAQLAETRQALQDKLDERKGVRVPAEDHEAQDEGEAWPARRPADRDAVLQPPAPEMPPPTRILQAACDHDADREAGQ